MATHGLWTTTKGIPMRLTVDGNAIEIDADPEMPLLWALRDLAGKPDPNSAAASPPAAPARCI